MRGLINACRSPRGKLALNLAMGAFAVTVSVLAARHFAGIGWPFAGADFRFVAAAGLLFLLGYAFKAYGWHRLFAPEERPKPLTLAASCGAASVTGAALPGRFDEVVRIAVVRRASGGRAGVSSRLSLALHARHDRHGGADAARVDRGRHVRHVHSIRAAMGVVAFAVRRCGGRHRKFFRAWSRAASSSALRSTAGWARASSPRGTRGRPGCSSSRPGSRACSALPAPTTPSASAFAPARPSRSSARRPLRCASVRSGRCPRPRWAQAPRSSWPAVSDLERRLLRGRRAGPRHSRRRGRARFRAALWHGGRRLALAVFLGGLGGKVLAVGMRWSFRGKDAGSVRSRMSYGRGLRRSPRGEQRGPHGIATISPSLLLRTGGRASRTWSAWPSGLTRTSHWRCSPRRPDDERRALDAHRLLAVGVLSRPRRRTARRPRVGAANSVKGQSELLLERTCELSGRGSRRESWRRAPRTRRRRHGSCSPAWYTLGCRPWGRSRAPPDALERTRAKRARPRPT